MFECLFQKLDQKNVENSWRNLQITLEKCNFSTKNTRILSKNVVDIKNADHQWKFKSYFSMALAGYSFKKIFNQIEQIFVEKKPMRMTHTSY